MFFLKVLFGYSGKLGYSVAILYLSLPNPTLNSIAKELTSEKRIYPISVKSWVDISIRDVPGANEENCQAIASDKQEGTLQWLFFSYFHA